MRDGEVLKEMNSLRDHSMELAGTYIYYLWIITEVKTCDFNDADGDTASYSKGEYECILGKMSYEELLEN
ncbi:MAG: hypothetical protein NC331_05865 [Lachnospiraceae bacterium]|nr:hypothetical protein [Lachnospiraceae bacterium]MCM1238894.1 hypothetical protein [Lachnospiraceae bacterium]